MTEREKVDAIMDKYNRNFSILQSKGTVRELKTVFNYVASEANHKQRLLVGLDQDTSSSDQF
ncbi:hypothetical protein [Xylocopilactobacillus apis]|uniref:Uncharacterized protein n=1 Tax=Xylocopilactobacillus apis TaxID=2932183 RepID=A0AAU9CWA1_9LACO|nr:hypothetical protein [Xylocopilactobacillus apis]BDR56706.1 hypothetical protein KIMC2_12680 [Xylocopilactobacillus apis]